MQNRTAAALILLTVCFVSTIFLDDSVDTTVITPSPSLQIGSVAASVSLTSTSTGRMLFVGDVLLARDVETKINLHGEYYPYRYIQDLFTSHEHVIANFEAPIPAQHTKTPDGSVNFSVDVKRLPAFKAAGFTHVSLANNHSYDKGEQGYHNTVEAFTDHDIVVLESDDNATSSYSVLQVGAHDIAVMPIDTTSVVFDAESFLATFTEVADESDLQVVFIHWGDEYELVHNESQAVLARWLIDVGVDAVVGHHPHVVQDIEIYNGSPIIYSLGNFIFDQYFSNEVQTGLAVAIDGNDLPTMTLYPVTSLGSQAAPRLMNQVERELTLTDIMNRSTTTAQTYIAAGSFTIPVELAISP